MLCETENKNVIKPLMFKLEVQFVKSVNFTFK